MPLIKSRKYPDKDGEYVDPETWADMKKNGLARRYRIEDSTDLHDAVIKAPTEILDFTDNGLPEKDPELTRDEVKAQLDELGVEYNTRLPYPKLLDLLNENKQNGD